MKKYFTALSLSLFLTGISAQQFNYDWQGIKPEKRKEIIQKMKPEERKKLLQEFRENMMIAELLVPENQQPEFKDLYNEYQEKQNDIKGKFVPSDNYKQMSDEEAARQLDESFNIGQQLLDNRKDYAQKFKQLTSPQQVLQMYQTEGKMRTKILDKKQDGSRNSGPQRRRP